ncbi:MAG: hypothetical protein ACR2LG_02805 [Actinomycetota bacterium]
MRRVLAVVVAILVIGIVAPANATPVATNNSEYDLLGRIFPDPQAGRSDAPGNSPYAKGDVPAADFIQVEEFHQGTLYLEKKFPGFDQRYNGNGMDLNRDWPTLGFTCRPYTPWSEPETRAFGKILKSVGPKDASGDPAWAGGSDLHGQLIDRAFSFTLIGGGERPYDKNQRVLQTVKGAWADAEKRLAYSPIIKPNDAPADDPRVYGVQWGTVWDTIDYTITGGVGDWIDSSIGLNGDGIDNEMSMSHLINCGGGTCFEPDAEQLHVDGNKSLIYSMLNYSLKPEKKTFKTEGRVGYLFNREVIKQRTNRFSRPPQFTELPPQQDIEDVTLNEANAFTHQFQVLGPSNDVYNGGIAAQLTCAVAPVSTCAVTEARLEKRIGPGDEEDPNSGEWQTIATYFNQSPVYLQAGQALHANLPKPGDWRVVVEGAGPADVFDLDINFTREKGWPDPGQIGFRASSMKFWKMLKRFAQPGIEKVTVDELDGRAWRDLDTLVITNKLYERFAGKLRRWVAETDGNLLLTDSALRMLPAMNLTDGGVSRNAYYAGYVNFATKTDERTYGHPLAHNINQDGAAEGQSGDENHRRQTYEPVPLGISIQTPDGDDASHAPVWYVDDAAWSAAEGSPTAVGTTGNRDQVSYGEIAFKGGRIRIIGALLPNPTKRFDHPYGIADYALTYSGYQLLKNSLSWSK